MRPWNSPSFLVQLITIIMLTKRKVPSCRNLCSLRSGKKKIFILVGRRSLLMQWFNDKISTETHWWEGAGRVLINYGLMLFNYDNLSITKWRIEQTRFFPDYKDPGHKVLCGTAAPSYTKADWTHLSLQCWKKFPGRKRKFFFALS